MIIRGIPLTDAKLMCCLFNSWHPVAFVYVFPTVLLMSCSVGEHFYIINVFCGGTQSKSVARNDNGM